MKFWKEDEFEISKEALFTWREQLIKTAYSLRVLERIASRYMSETTDSNPRVKEILSAAWAEEITNSNEIWATIGAIENILLNKHGVHVLNALDLHQLMLGALEREIVQQEVEVK